MKLEIMTYISTWVDGYNGKIWVGFAGPLCISRAYSFAVLLQAPHHPSGAWVVAPAKTYQSPERAKNTRTKML